MKTKGLKINPDYDVIVIGTGIGGSACAALLSQAGFKALALEKNKEIAEDERFKSQDEVQKVIDKYTAQIDAALETKEKEIEES